MYWPMKEVSIYDVFLDQLNIRLPENPGTQKALIQDLFSNEDALEIVKSIYQYGIFPDEFPIVVHEKPKYIVIEGNRRLAALKAMAEPDIVPSFKTKLQTYNKEKWIKLKLW
jgi:hypothetical protein